MKRRIAVSIASVALSLGGVVATQAGAAPTRTVSTSGGVVRFAATVRNATTCHWSSSPTIAGFTATTKCKTGNVSRSAKFPANTTTTAKAYAVTLIVRGKTTTVDHWKVNQAKETPPTRCTGPCAFTFPSPDIFGAASIAVNSISQNVAWPNPNYNDLPAGDQLDELNATVCAGPTGITDVSMTYAGSLSLSVSSGLQASVDPQAYDASSLGNYGEIAAGQCVTGNIYYDVPTGSTWAFVNYTYEATNGDTLTYVWNAP
jgi:hypothetical protein